MSLRWTLRHPFSARHTLGQQRHPLGNPLCVPATCAWDDMPASLGSREARAPQGTSSRSSHATKVTCQVICMLISKVA